MRDPGRRLSRATDTSLLRAGRRPSGSPVTRFAATGLLAVVAVGIVGVLFVRHVSRGEALSDAEDLTRLAGEGIVAPVRLLADRARQHGGELELQSTPGRGTRVRLTAPASR
jgi:hypothetical protein